jgi:hypothetical protein
MNLDDDDDDDVVRSKLNSPLPPTFHVAYLKAFSLSHVKNKLNDIKKTKGNPDSRNRL